MKIDAAFRCDICGDVCVGSPKDYASLSRVDAIVYRGRARTVYAEIPVVVTPHGKDVCLDCYTIVKGKLEKMLRTSLAVKEEEE